MEFNNNLSENTIPSFYITNTCYKTHTVVQPFIENTNTTINTVNTVEKVNNEVNVDNELDMLNAVCLITGDMLESDSIRLECGHRFNYIPLLNDLIEYKKHMDNTYSKRINTIRCPYCRQIQHKLIPYYATYNIKACNINMSEEEFVFNLKKEKEDKKRKKEEEKLFRLEQKKKRDESKKQKELLKSKKNLPKSEKNLPKNEKSVL